MKRKYIIFSILFMSCLWVGMTYTSGYFVKGYIERSLKIKLHGSIVPSLVQTSFLIKDSRFDWKDKVKLESGDLSVNYHLLPTLLGKPLRVFIRGNDLKIVLFSDWAKMFKVEDVPVEEFSMDFSLDREGINEIHFLDVNSPQMKFKLSK